MFVDLCYSCLMNPSNEAGEQNKFSVFATGSFSENVKRPIKLVEVEGQTSSDNNNNVKEVIPVPNDATADEFGQHPTLINER